MTLDALIIGGGIAGISCALELLETKKSFLLLESETRLGGQLHRIHNVIPNLAAGQFANGADLLCKLEDMVSQLQLAHHLRCKVSKVDLHKKLVTAGSEEFVSKTLVLATGYRKRLIELPGQQAFAAQITYHHHVCLSKIAGQNVVVIGGGDNAAMDALDLAKHCRQVFLLQRSAKLRARPDLQQNMQANPRIKILLHSQITALKGKDCLSEVEVTNSLSGNSELLPVSFIVIKAGDLPNTELFRGQLDMDETGHIKINAHCMTSCADVFAIGDITHPNYPRLATAVGHGAIAAYGVRKLLEPALLKAGL